jgi:hypothetical protein
MLSNIGFEAPASNFAIQLLNNTASQLRKLTGHFGEPIGLVRAENGAGIKWEVFMAAVGHKA